VYRSQDTELRRPPRLFPGARVALVAPAGPVSPERVERALALCARLELVPRLGASARARRAYLAGTDAERAADLAAALTDEDVDAVWALRGGYGTMRILERCGLERAAANPRAFLGFSDNTAVHAALGRRGVVSFHAPHPGGAFPPTTEAVFRRVLFSADRAGTLPLPPATEAPRTLVPGSADGPLVGGNLALLAALCGTPFAPRTAGCILVVEDVGEPAYRVDRALTQLRLAGLLDHVAGLALGRFTERPGDEPAALLEDLLGSTASALGVPAVLGLPVGHVDENWTLPLGVRSRLDAGAATLTLLEAAVT
jgi:muramoyltetrapeptide carboxypeptidase